MPGIVALNTRRGLSPGRGEREETIRIRRPRRGPNHCDRAHALCLGARFDEAGERPSRTSHPLRPDART